MTSNGRIDDSWREYRRAISIGAVVKAREIASQTAHFHEERGDLRHAGIWYRALATSFIFQGRLEEAEIHGRRSVAIQPDPYEQALSLITVGKVFVDRYQCVDGLEFLAEAEEIGRSIDADEYFRGHLHAIKGLAYGRLGHTDQSLSEWDDSAKLLATSGSLSHAALVLNNIGFVSAHAGLELWESERRVVSALELLGRDPHLHFEASCYDSLGFVQVLKGRYDEAERYLTRSARVFASFNDDAELIWPLLHLSELNNRIRKYEVARRNASRALELATRLNLEPRRIQAGNQLLSIGSTISSIAREAADFHGLVIGGSATMRTLVVKLKRIARTAESVLVVGETGTGKELVARAIHKESQRRGSPFVPFNCAAISRELIEARLFGFKKGAFTGAERDNLGVIRSARGGTLFLDEIADLAVDAQGALLRFLQSGEIQPVGVGTPQRVDVRIIAATNHDLRNDVDAGRFRRDLFYRLNVATLWIPPLRQRANDIPLLVMRFASEYSKRYNLPQPCFTGSDIASLLEYDWPGNVRELENYAKRLVLFGERQVDAGIPFCEGLPRRLNSLSPTERSTSRSWRRLSESEKQRTLEDALEATSGNVTLAARHLGISRRTIQKARRRTSPSRR